MNTLDFNGKTAIVTGGSQGIGAATVARLRASGAQVEIWDLDAAARVDVRDERGQQEPTDLAVAGHVELMLVVGGVGEPQHSTGLALAVAQVA